MGAKINIVLIGMPGAGKSTVGKLLAKQLGKQFIDTDELIAAQRQTALQEVVDSDGYKTLRQIEETVICALDVQKHIIATGGSAVYSELAIEHLKKSGVIVFLDVSCQTMQQRIDNESSRGLARPPSQSLSELFHERLPLYQKAAEIIVDCEQLSVQTVAEKVMKVVDTVTRDVIT